MSYKARLANISVVPLALTSLSCSRCLAAERLHFIGARAGQVAAMHEDLKTVIRRLEG